MLRTAWYDVSSLPSVKFSAVVSFIVMGAVVSKVGFAPYLDFPNAA